MVLVVKNKPVNSGDVTDMGSIPRSGRSPGGGNNNPLQYSCLESPWGLKESDMTERLTLSLQQSNITWYINGGASLMALW